MPLNQKKLTRFLNGKALRGPLKANHYYDLIIKTYEVLNT
jgi:hypothetical protein